MFSPDHGANIRPFAENEAIYASVLDPMAAAAPRSAADAFKCLTRLTFKYLITFALRKEDGKKLNQC